MLILHYGHFIQFVFHCQGLSYTGGTLVRDGVKATDDSKIVQSMKNAGAIPLCVTNTPELCAGYESTNWLYGTTCNPYNTRHSAGGSSGGEVSYLKFNLFNRCFRR